MGKYGLQVSRPQTTFSIINKVCCQYSDLRLGIKENNQFPSCREAARAAACHGEVEPPRPQSSLELQTKVREDFTITYRAYQSLINFASASQFQCLLIMG